jgi:two-component sensor histidine kinase
VVNDYGFFGLSRMFYGLLALRVVIVAYTILFLKSLRRLPNYRSYDRAEFFWGLFLALTHITANATRPDDFVAHTVAIVLAVFVMVIAIPNRFTNQLILSLVYTVGETLIIAPSLMTSPQASFTVLLNMFMATAIAIASSWLLHFWRRREFLTREEIQKARVETEMQLTERKKAEEALAKIEIARQKEIHHRIKNNLQVISSLLDLEAEKFNNKECINNLEVLEAFRESQDRVISIALIHEELHEGEGADTLNFSLYLQRLIKNLFQIYRLGNSNINLNMDLGENIFFDMDTAVPLGIVVNELVSNSLKYAFPDRENGEIQIKLFSEETGNESNNKEYLTRKVTSYTLVVSDNGAGIPEEIDFENPDTLGLQLVNILIDQLDGEIELKRDKGTGIKIRFNVKQS